MWHGSNGLIEKWHRCDKVSRFYMWHCHTRHCIHVTLVFSTTLYLEPFNQTQLMISAQTVKKSGKNPFFFLKILKASKKILEHHKKFEKISKNKISLFFRQVRWRCHQACWTLLNRIHFQSLMLMLLVLSLLSLDPPRLVFKLVPRFWLAKIRFDMIRLNSKKVILGIQPRYD